MAGALLGGVAQGLDMGDVAHERSERLDMDKKREAQTEQYRQEQMSTMEQAREQSAMLFEGELEQQRANVGLAREKLGQAQREGRIDERLAGEMDSRWAADDASLERSEKWAADYDMPENPNAQDYRQFYKAGIDAQFNEVMRLQTEGGSPANIQRKMGDLKEARAFNEMLQGDAAKDLIRGYASGNTEEMVAAMAVGGLNIDEGSLQGSAKDGYTYTSDGIPGDMGPEDMAQYADAAGVKMPNIATLAAAGGKAAVDTQKRIDKSVDGLKKSVLKDREAMGVQYGPNSYEGAAAIEGLLNRGAKISDFDAYRILEGGKEFEDKGAYKDYLNRELGKFVPREEPVEGAAPGADPGAAPGGAPVAAPAPGTDEFVGPEIPQEEMVARETTGINEALNEEDPGPQLQEMGYDDKQINQIYRKKYGVNHLPPQRIRDSAGTVEASEKEVSENKEQIKVINDDLKVAQRAISKSKPTSRGRKQSMNAEEQEYIDGLREDWQSGEYADLYTFEGFKNRVIAKLKGDKEGLEIDNKELAKISNREKQKLNSYRRLHSKRGA